MLVRTRVCARVCAPAQLVAAYVIVGLVVAGIGLTSFVLDQREQAAITADDLFAALALGDMGADPALTNAEGKTAAEIARDNGSSSVVQILQAHAAGK